MSGSPSEVVVAPGPPRPEVEEPEARAWPVSGVPPSPAVPLLTVSCTVSKERDSSWIMFLTLMPARGIPMPGVLALLKNDLRARSPHRP